MRWRRFLLGCAELFGYGGGKECMVARYLLERQAVRPWPKGDEMQRLAKLFFVAWRERTLAARLLWLFLFLGLGSMAIASYMLVALPGRRVRPLRIEPSGGGRQGA